MLDLTGLTREDLETLRDQIDQRLVDLEKEQRANALTELKALAKRHGVSVAEMIELASANASPTGVLPKYRDPENPGNTWTGRGRKPKWLVAALENGEDLNTFAI